MTGVLSGVRVVELGQVLAGPFAGAISLTSALMSSR